MGDETDSENPPEDEQEHQPDDDEDGQPDEAASGPDWEVADTDPEELKRVKRALANQRNRWLETRRRERELRRQLEEAQRQQMTDNERAIADAKEEGRRLAYRETGAERATDRLRSLLAGKVADIDDVLGLIGTTSRFVNDDGSLDERAIKQAVERAMKLAPASNGDGHEPLSRALRGAGQPGPGDPDTWLRGVIGRG